MNHKKILSMILHRDELLSEVLASRKSCPKEILGERYLRIARRTAQIADEIELETAPETLSASIQRGLADAFYQIGGQYKQDTAEAEAFRLANAQGLRDTITAQLERIDSGEEVLVPFTREMLDDLGKDD